MDESPSEPANGTSVAGIPFKALIAGWSLIVVILSVAGYSYRWNYYYNFGLQSLVLAAPLENLPAYAIEILRNRRFLIDLLRLGLIYLLPFHVVVLTLNRAREIRNARVRQAVQLVARVLALDNRLVLDAATAGLLILVAFRAGGDAGYRSYLINVVESTSNLAKVTAIGRPDSTESLLPIACDTRTIKDEGSLRPPPFLGDPDVVSSLIAGRACSTETWSWRLLLRDEKYVYVFATVQDSTQRPQTLVLPHSEALTLVFQ
jgi:hypothetical protein